MSIMKDQPLSLALVIMNVLLLSLFFYVIKLTAENRQKEYERMYNAQLETNKLLYQCVPGPRTEFKLQSDEAYPVPLPQPRPPEAQ